MFSELLGTRRKKQEQDQERRQPTCLLRGLLPKFAESWTSLTQGILSLLLVSICAVLGYRALVYNVFWFGWGWKVLSFKQLFFNPINPYSVTESTVTSNFHSWIQCLRFLWSFLRGPSVHKNTVTKRLNELKIDDCSVLNVLQSRIFKQIAGRVEGRLFARIFFPVFK